MKYLLVLYGLVSLLSCNAKTGDTRWNKIQTFVAGDKEDFGFTKQWSYPWYIIKNEDGSFENTMGETVTAEDTAHIYFTSTCYTNLQGGYPIRHCRAVFKNDTLKIALQDGMPAYASTFNIYVHKGRFYFSPDIIFPAPGENRTKILKQNLALDWEHNNEVKGRMNFSFRITGDPTGYYLKGYFKAPVNLSD